jgi:arylsulfatase A-like enzyme
MRKLSLSILLALAATLGASAERPTQRADDRPNIVIVMADDMGFSDIGCYGGEIPTPHLDALAAGGLRFTQFYNAGRCCPTRASLLTGLYSHQAGIGHMTGDYGTPGYRGALNDRCVTIGDVARSAGYFTAVSGKWHVGSSDESMRPLARGFDRFYGVPEGGGFYFQVKKGRTVVLNEKTIASPEKPLPDGWYSTDAFTDHGIRFIGEAVGRKQPFLLYLAHNAPHFPLQADEEDIARFRGRFRDGWDQLGDARYRRQVEMGLVDGKWPRAPRPEGVADWDSLTNKEKDRFDHLMSAYAACVHRMDRSIGRLVAALKEHGQFENTLVLFLSDNGASAEGGNGGRTEGDPTRHGSQWFAGKSWAWHSNVPFRRFKMFNDEGGIATPLIAHWPAGIKEGGKWCRQPGHAIDLMATVVELSGAKYPAERGGEKILPMEGTSLVPAFRGGKLGRDAMFWEHQGNAAVRSGDWKLVRVGGKGKWELFNLAEDRTEQRDLAGDHPERVEALAGKWADWAARCGVSPNGLPRRRKKK